MGWLGTLVEVNSFGVVHDAATASSDDRPTPRPRAAGATISMLTKPCSKNVYSTTQYATGPAAPSATTAEPS
ncbi:hypothetical protein OHA80_12420 [Streptomyces niveus]|uniref:hypothetical protein n=1 Tax=Streptomyces niveus TaxID=193462 RepID=UPI002E31F16C|nr:hypothetical protein [Streptomyces niveus]